MAQKKTTSVRIKLQQAILALWKTTDDLYAPGVRFDGDAAHWSGGYGIEANQDIPEFVKKDNDGWVYVQKSRDK